MKKCIIHANCQARPFIRLLTESQEFMSTWCIEYVVNFAKEPITSAMLADCDLFLYQHLGERWGDLSSKKLLAQLPNYARSFCLPNVINYKFWPFSIEPEKPYDLWLDTHIETLLERDLSVNDTALLVMRADFSKIYDLVSLQNASQGVEAKKTYVGNQEINEFIQENIDKEMLFTTPNHPAGSLLFYITNHMLKEFGFATLKTSPEKNSLVCDDEFYLPIHPFFGKYYNVPYITENTRYPVYGNNLTYREFLLCYIDARKNKIPLFSYFEQLH